VLLAGKPFELNSQYHRQIKFMSPNVNELRKIVETLKPTLSSSSSSLLWTCNDDSKIDNRKFLHEIAQHCSELHDIVENIIVTADSFGIFIQRSGDCESKFFTKDLHYIDNGECADGGRKLLRHYPCQIIEKNVKSSSGAGDAFNAGFITAMLKQKSEAICVSVGFEAALASLRSVNAVPDKFFNSNHECWKRPAQFDVIQ
jgi:pfkB family carbohydrate kinase